MEIGAIYRRQIRRLLDIAADHGVSYREDKSLLDSEFVVSGPTHILQVVHNQLTKMTTDANEKPALTPQREPAFVSPQRLPRTGASTK